MGSEPVPQETANPIDQIKKGKQDGKDKSS